MVGETVHRPNTDECSLDTAVELTYKHGQRKSAWDFSDPAIPLLPLNLPC